MIPFKSPPLGGPRPPLVQTYSGPLSDIGVPRPSGASTVIIEAIGYGGEGSYIELGGGSVQEFSGGGAAYARATIPAPVNGLRLTATTARGDYTTVVNVDSGLTVCRAQNGNRYVAGSAANSVGDVKFSGGAGGNRTDTEGAYGGGGAAGPAGDGSPGTFTAGTTQSASGGAGGGSPAGSGGSVAGSTVQPGANHGGGSAYSSNYGGSLGGSSLIRLTWIF